MATAVVDQNSHRRSSVSQHLKRVLHTRDLHRDPAGPMLQRKEAPEEIFALPYTDPRCASAPHQSEIGTGPRGPSSLISAQTVCKTSSPKGGDASEPQGRRNSSKVSGRAGRSGFVFSSQDGQRKGEQERRATRRLEDQRQHFEKRLRKLEEADQARNDPEIARRQSRRLTKRPPSEGRSRESSVDSTASRSSLKQVQSFLSGARRLSWSRGTSIESNRDTLTSSTDVSKGLSDRGLSGDSDGKRFQPASPDDSSELIADTSVSSRGTDALQNSVPVNSVRPNSPPRVVHSTIKLANLHESWIHAKPFAENISIRLISSAQSPGTKIGETVRPAKIPESDGQATVAKEAHGVLQQDQLVSLQNSNSKRNDKTLLAFPSSPGPPRASRTSSADRSSHYLKHAAFKSSPLAVAASSSDRTASPVETTNMICTDSRNPERAKSSVLRKQRALPTISNASAQQSPLSSLWQRKSQAGRPKSDAVVKSSVADDFHHFAPDGTKVVPADESLRLPERSPLRGSDLRKLRTSSDEGSKARHLNLRPLNTTNYSASASLASASGGAGIVRDWSELLRLRSNSHLAMNKKEPAPETSNLSDRREASTMAESLDPASPIRPSSLVSDSAAAHTQPTTGAGGRARRGTSSSGDSSSLTIPQSDEYETACGSASNTSGSREEEDARSDFSTTSTSPRPAPINPRWTRTSTNDKNCTISIPPSHPCSSRTGLRFSIPATHHHFMPMATFDPRTASRELKHPKLGSLVAKVFVICCQCRNWHDMPADVYSRLPGLSSLLGRARGGSRATWCGGDREGKGLASADGSHSTVGSRCCWCEHRMTKLCCEGWTAIVQMRERLH